MTTPTKPRVVIDCMQSGGFFVFSDEGVEVVVRSAHLPGEELFRAGRHPIPEAWLSDKPIASAPGGTEAEQFAELVAEMDKLVVSTIEAARKSV
jgi:hypothetical protein